MAQGSQIFVSLNQNGQRQKYAQIAISDNQKLKFYDIWPLDADIESTDFKAPALAIGSIYTARITKLDAKTNLAFVTLGNADAVMKLKPKQAYTEGQYILAEITSDAYDDKATRVRFVGDVKQAEKTRPQLYRPAENLAQHCLKLAAEHQCQITCDDFAFFAALKKQATPAEEIAFLGEVQFNKKNTLSLLEENDLTTQIDELSQSQITLKNGGNIIIQHNQAMTVIDVNSGTYTGNSMTNDVNQQAAQKLFEQLQLRHIGGLIIVDFLKYPKKSSRDKFATFLRDQAKIHAIEMGSYTGFGLAEFKRKRSAKRLDQKLSEINND